MYTDYHVCMYVLCQYGVPVYTANYRLEVVQSVLRHSCRAYLIGIALRSRNSRSSLRIVADDMYYREAGELAIWGPGPKNVCTAYSVWITYVSCDHPLVQSSGIWSETRVASSGRTNSDPTWGSSAASGSRPPISILNLDMPLLAVCAERFEYLGT